MNAGQVVAMALLAVVSPAAGYSAEITAHQTAAQVAAPVNAFHSALRRGDAAGAAALLAEDALIFEEGGAERSRAEYVARHLAADVEFSRAVTSTVTSRSARASDGLAYVTSEGRVKGLFRGKRVDRLTTETMILRKLGGQWKIVHIHWSSAPAR
jgi:ketosteroid isomerase-like protein